LESGAITFVVSALTSHFRSWQSLHWLGKFLQTR
jgi:hypothetical protein